MKLKRFITSIFLTFIGTAYCMAQVKADSSKDSILLRLTTINAQPKLRTNQSIDRLSKLSHNIHCSLLDRADNLWFGTTGDGVYHFDGKSFTNFTVEDGLSDNCVWSVLEDKTGNIWFGTDAGVCFYDGKSIASFQVEPIDSLRRAVYSILQDQRGILWFGTANGVYCYDGKSCKRFLENDNVINQKGLHLKRVERILEDKDGNIWFCSGMGGGEGVCRYDGNSITNFKPNGDVWVPYILKDKAGNIWFSGRSHGYFRFDGEIFTDFTEGVGAILIPENQTGNSCLMGKVGFGPMLEDKTGNIWFVGKMIRFGGDGGIWRYDGKSCTNYSVPQGFGDEGIWSMVEDAEGNIWVGTSNTSLFRFDGKCFTRYSE